MRLDKVDAVFAEEDTAESTARMHSWSHHRLEGICYLGGAGIEAGRNLEDANITDVAPTVLRLLGEPVPRDMDGRVLDEAFVPELRGQETVRSDTSTAVEEGEAGGAYDEEDQEAIERRLRDLGYLD
jgi:hypothetical protein